MEELPNCETYETHPEQQTAVSVRLPSEDSLFALADLYKIFGDSTRLRILYVLHESELCVCDIAALCGMTVSAISHQLQVLKRSRLIKYRRSGKSVFYSLDDEHVHSILAQGMEHLSEK